MGWDGMGRRDGKESARTGMGDVISSGVGGVSRDLGWRGKVEVEIEGEHLVQRRRSVARVEIHDGGVRVAMNAAGHRGARISDDRGWTQREEVVATDRSRFFRSDDRRVEEEVWVPRRHCGGGDGRVWLEGKPLAAADDDAATVVNIEVERGRERDLERRFGGFPVGGLHRAALASGAAGVPVVIRAGEVGLGLGTAELAGGVVVRPRRLLGGVEGPEPDPALLPRVPYLRRVPPPWPLPNPPEVRLLPPSSSYSAGDGQLLGGRHG
ncbi:hypothetical protein BHE74_00043572 [Ensete ventricosum]|nr:hypothetical protein BHE74_00043572 [Ensete ventricosum]